MYSYQSNTAKKCFDTILEIQPKDSSGGGGETRESSVRRQAGEMLEKLPNDYIPHEVWLVLDYIAWLSPPPHSLSAGEGKAEEDGGHCSHEHLLEAGD